MKQIFDINYCLSLEDEIYNQTTYLPAMVFKKKYDNYFFLVMVLLDVQANVMILQNA